MGLIKDTQFLSSRLKVDKFASCSTFDLFTLHLGNWVYKIYFASLLLFCKTGRKLYFIYFGVFSLCKRERIEVNCEAGTCLSL